MMCPAVTSDSDNCTAMISDADECQRTLYIWIAEASDVKGSAALEAVFENSDFAGQLSNSNAVSFNTNDCTDDDKRKVNVSSTYSDTSVSDAVDILRKFYEENDCFEEAAGALSSGIAGALVLFLVAAFIMM